MTPITYRDFVDKGHELVKKINELKDLERCYQAKIARYALEVCTIRHGGKSKNLYTIKAYALDIRLNPKTVQQWVSIYRNVLEKIGVEDPTPEEWARASKANNILRLDRTIDNKKDGKPGTRTAYKKNVPASEVKSLYDSIDEKPFVGECHALTLSAKHDLHTLRKYEGELISIPENDLQRLEKSAQYTKSVIGVRDLGIAREKRLAHLMEILDETSDIINDYLTQKQRQKRA